VLCRLYSVLWLLYIVATLNFEAAVICFHCGYNTFSLRLYYVFIAAILRPTNYYMETSNLCKVELGCVKFNNKKNT
jgi:hypothetical protein